MAETQEAPRRYPRPAEHSHPGPREYVKVAIFLAIVTAAEVAVYYVPALRPTIVAWLIPMMVVKFAAVALYFMHLRFDSRIFRRFFLTGIILALSVYAIVLVSVAVVVARSR